MGVPLKSKKIAPFAIKLKDQFHWSRHVKPFIKSSGVSSTRIKRGGIDKLERLPYVGVYNGQFFHGSETFVSSRKIPIIEYPTKHIPKKQTHVMDYPNIMKMKWDIDHIGEMFGFDKNFRRLKIMPQILAGVEKTLISRGKRKNINKIYKS